MRNLQKVKYRPWFQTFRKWSGQLIGPFIIFQLLRTLIFPTIVDIFLLSLFIIVAISLYWEII
ncbi:hypothetical protein [Bacillus rubiinfantis]|uniref:hypothetical protein n=1 Tax=Bacillus rubiinfantis TaxID=1499680 RepID=UPI0005A8F73B|nr:hypothetical protein [Bacillus rubiinfantis]